MIFQELPSSGNGRCVEVAEEKVSVAHGLQEVHQNSDSAILVIVNLI